MGPWRERGVQQIESRRHDSAANMPRDAAVFGGQTEGDGQGEREREKEKKHGKEMG